MRGVGVGLGVLALVVVAGGTPPAAAVCAGATIAVTPTSGEAGSTVQLSGEHWGDNCFDDIGGPPPGQGPLGNPQQDIEVRFVDAAGTATVVATADADADYRWSVEATVPPGAVEGAASFDATSVTGFDVTPAPFTVAQVDDVIPATPAFTG